MLLFRTLRSPRTWLLLTSFQLSMSAAFISMMDGTCTGQITQEELDGWYADASILSNRVYTAWQTGGNPALADPLTKMLFGSLSTLQYQLAGNVIRAVETMATLNSTRFYIYVTCPSTCDGDPTLSTDSGNSIPNLSICPRFFQLKNQYKSLPDVPGNNEMCETAPRYMVTWYPGQFLFHEALHNRIQLRKEIHDPIYGRDYTSDDSGYTVGTHGIPSPFIDVLQVDSGRASINNPDTYAWFGLLMFRRLYCGWDNGVPEAQLPFLQATVPYGNPLETQGDPAVWPQLVVTTCPLGTSTPTIDTVPSQESGKMVDVLYCWIPTTTPNCPDNFQREVFNSLGVTGTGMETTQGCFPVPNVEGTRAREL